MSRCGAVPLTVVSKVSVFHSAVNRCLRWSRCGAVFQNRTAVGLTVTKNRTVSSPGKNTLLRAGCCAYPTSQKITNRLVQRGLLRYPPRRRDGASEAECAAFYHSKKVGLPTQARLGALRSGVAQKITRKMRRVKLHRTSLFVKQAFQITTHRVCEQQTAADGPRNVPRAPLCNFTCTSSASFGACYYMKRRSAEG